MISLSEKNSNNVGKIYIGDWAQATPYTPFLDCKTAVCMGIPIFLIFAPKLAEAVLMSTHTLCFEQNYEKKNPMKIFNFYS